MWAIARPNHAFVCDATPISPDLLAGLSHTFPARNRRCFECIELSCLCGDTVIRLCEGFPHCSFAQEVCDDHNVIKDQRQHHTKADSANKQCCLAEGFAASDYNCHQTVMVPCTCPAWMCYSVFQLLTHAVYFEGNCVLAMGSAIAVWVWIHNLDCCSTF